METFCFLENSDICSLLILQTFCDKVKTFYAEALFLENLMQKVKNIRQIWPSFLPIRRHCTMSVRNKTFPFVYTTAKCFLLCYNNFGLFLSRRFSMRIGVSLIFSFNVDKDLSLRCLLILEVLNLKKKNIIKTRQFYYLFINEYTSTCWYKSFIKMLFIYYTWVDMFTSYHQWYENIQIQLRINVHHIYIYITSDYLTCLNNQHII